MLRISKALFFAFLLLNTSSATPTFKTATITPFPSPTETSMPTIHARFDASTLNLPHFTPGHFSPTLNLPPQCTQTIKPDANGYVPPGTCGSQYNFYPSFSAALAFSVLFGIVNIVHVVQAIVYKKGFCWVIIVAAVWETGSFVTRTLSTKNQQSSGLALVSQLLVLLAPLWVNAFAYTLLGRMMYFYLPSHSLLGLRASTLATVFVLLDVVSFVIQLVGGSMGGANQPADQIMKGVHIYMGGIGLQEFFLVIFFIFAIKFQLELQHLERVGVLPGPNNKADWRRLLFTIYLVLALITVRVVFRLIEFSAGTTASNPLPFHEVYFYVLEATPMLLAISAFAVSHPGKVLVGQDSEIPKAMWRQRRALKKALKKQDVLVLEEELKLIKMKRAGV